MSRKAAIDAFCKSCIWDRHASGTWREQVAACPAPRCPLYPYRPMPCDQKSRSKCDADNNATDCVQFPTKGAN